MNPAQLLALFDRISEAPEAISRLRRFILELAIRGRLVPQDATERHTDELLKVKTGVLNLTPGNRPPSWICARLGDLLKFEYGKPLPASDRLEAGSVRVFGSNGVVGYCETALAEAPAIIIGRKGSAGALNLCDGPSWTTDVAYFVTLLSG
jgi:type I restriction enzyme S subunit